MSLNQRNNKRDRFFFIATLIGWLLWITSVSPLRIYAIRISPYAYWISGVAPNFFAGSTFAFFQAYAMKIRPLASVIYAAVLVTAAEVIQLYIPRYTFDKWDIIAGIIGVAIAMPVLLWREHRRP